MVYYFGELTEDRVVLFFVQRFISVGIQKTVVGWATRTVGMLIMDLRAEAWKLNYSVNRPRSLTVVSRLKGSTCSLHSARWTVTLSQHTHSQTHCGIISVHLCVHILSSSIQMPCQRLSHCLHRLIPSPNTKSTFFLCAGFSGRSHLWTRPWISFILLHPVGITHQITNS